MWKFLLGPLLLGTTYGVGSIYGVDAEQLVHKPTDEVYAAVAEAVDRPVPDGTMQLEGGRPVPFEVKVERTPGERLLVRLMMDGREGAEAAVDFAAADGGASTLMKVQVHADHAVLRDALAGTDKAKLAYAPDWMLNLTAKPLLRKLAEQIEKGQAVGGPAQGFQSEAEWESSLPPDQQEQVQQWREYDATRPMVDPNAAAENYMAGTPAGVRARSPKLPATREPSVIQVMSKPPKIV
jgi:hypothetical protein